jgi:adenylate kinase family enzyme
MQNPVRNMPDLRIHTFGASGTGTTTLGSGLARHFDIPHLDTDSFYWMQSDPPFSQKNPPELRLKGIFERIHSQTNWVLSGSLISWGNSLLEHFTHVVFVTLPWELRKERLIQREIDRYGEAALAPGGKMHTINREFMAWSERYDSAGLEQRSRLAHEQWIKTLPAHIRLIRLESSCTREAAVDFVLGKL